MPSVTSPQAGVPAAFGEGFVGELYGKYYQLAKAGQIFIGSSAIGGVLIGIATTTAPTFLLANPSGSGKNLVMLKASYGYISGTVIAGAWHYSSCATPVAANITAVAPQNALIGAGSTSVSLFAPAATNTVASATVYRHSAISNGAPITSTTSYYYLSETFDGDLIIPPGKTIFPSIDPVNGGTFATTFVWAEMPL